MRESELLEHIYRRSAGLAGSHDAVVVGPGDDCAVVRTGAGDLLLLTVDQLVEGRHYEPGTEIDLIARKAVARSVSDIAAMGGTPAWALATALLPSGYEHADALFDAMHKWALHFGCPLVGGDIASHGSAHHPLTLTVTIGGRMDAGVAPVLRSGARAGGELLLSGAIGGAVGGGRHLSFEPRLEIGRAAAMAGAHAMIDLSDGLGRDAGRVARESGVVLEIEADRLPINTGCADWRSAIAEGEDYELLIVMSPADLERSPRLRPGLVSIGRVRACAQGEQPGAMVIDGDGCAHDVGDLGWDHE